ncbi:MAG: hypothetical protein HY052_06635 [Proteobacteria bacterium]|nr:hypothetical protein [Pseudomonadota bacterium]
MANPQKKPDDPKPKDKEYSHFHLDMNSLLQHILKGSQNLTPEEADAMSQPQKPEVFLICCIDSRIQPDKDFDYGPGVTLEYRPIAAVIPPPGDADAAFLSRMAFRRLKDVRNIILMVHSDCGGALASIQIPNPDLKTGGDLDIIASEIHRTGLDVPGLSKTFLTAANGDAGRAANRLAKEAGVQSLKNLLGYKGRQGFATIADEMANGDLHVALLYYDIKKRSCEKYDADKNAWEPLMDAGTPPKNAPPTP